VAGKRYRIEGTTNLMLGFPDRVSNNIAGTPATNRCTLPPDPVLSRFYRVVVE
jgi:hypothetical protein